MRWLGALISRRRRDAKPWITSADRLSSRTSAKSITLSYNDRYCEHGDRYKEHRMRFRR
jgi:hypothetical protein